MAFKILSDIKLNYAIMKNNDGNFYVVNDHIQQDILNSNCVP